MVFEEVTATMQEMVKMELYRTAQNRKSWRWMDNRVIGERTE